MPHLIERAPSGRAKCRGCAQRIDKDELRVGERLPNPFAEGEMTLWFHPVCAAYKRPGPFLEATKTATETLERQDALVAEAERGLAHRRLPRIDGGQRAPTGRARCRCCREMIAKDSWRIPLVFYEEGRFHESGFIHAACSREYLGTAEVIERIRHFSAELCDEDLEELRAELLRS